MPPSRLPARPRSFCRPRSCRSAVPAHPAGTPARWRATGGARDSLRACACGSVSEGGLLNPSRLHPLAALAVGFEENASAGQQPSLDRPVHKLLEKPCHLTVPGAQQCLSLGDLLVAALDVRHAATTTRSPWVSAKVRPSLSRLVCLPVIAIHLWQMIST